MGIIKQSISTNVFSTIIKNLENRWGLTLVSFLAPKAQKEIEAIQSKLFDCCNVVCPVPRDERGGHSLKLYDLSNLHCTHLTLKRSNPCSPIKKKDFLKPGAELFELYDILNEVISELSSFEGVLDNFKIMQNGIELILFGQCSKNVDIENRCVLLSKLMEHLPIHFNLDPRKYEQDSSQFHKLHCSIGYVKRPQLINSKKFTKIVESLKFPPIAIKMEEIHLVHYRYRSLSYPQEGIVTFEIGRKSLLNKDEFAKKINIQ